MKPDELKNELDKIIAIKEKALKELCAKLKAGCNTYADVQNKISLQKKHFSWLSSDRGYLSLLNEIERVLEEEKSGLPITNRRNSKCAYKGLELKLGVATDETPQ